MRSTEWLPASCLLLRLVPRLAGVTPRAAIGHRGRSTHPDGAGLVEAEDAGLGEIEGGLGIGDFLAAPLEASLHDEPSHVAA